MPEEGLKGATYILDPQAELLSQTGVTNAGFFKYSVSPDSILGSGLFVKHQSLKLAYKEAEQQKITVV